MYSLDGIVHTVVGQLGRKMAILCRQGKAVGRRGAQLGIARGDVIGTQIDDIGRQAVAR